MGSVNLLAMATNVPAELIAQLQPNDPIGDVHWWPLAMGYWVLIILCLLVTTIGFFAWHKKKTYRRYMHYFKLIQRLPQNQQHAQLHLLLRKILQDKEVPYASISERKFAEIVRTTLQLSQTPSWVNAHYSQQNTPINWQQAEHIVKQWVREVSI